MSGKYISGTQQVEQGNIDFVGDTIVAYLVDSTYTPDYDVDSSLTNIPESARLSKSFLDGVFLDGVNIKAVSTLFTRVEASREISRIILCTNGNTTDNSLLIAGFSVPLTTTNGEDVVVDWDSEGLMGY